MQEPLLRSSAVSHTPPQHAFTLRDEATEEHELVPSTIISSASPPIVRQHQSSHAPTVPPTPIAKLMGRPFAQSIDFWCTALPSAVILGAVIGCISLVLIVGPLKLMELWRETGMDADQQGQWWWLAVTTAGGFGAGLVLVFAPGPPSMGIVRDYYDDIGDLFVPAGIVSVLSRLATVVASVAALASGAPLGVEVAVGAAATAVGATFGCSVDRRWRAARTMSCLAAGLGSFFTTPLLGPLVVSELSTAMRPTMQTLDAVVQAEVVGDHSFQPTQHDVMEVVLLQLTAASASVLVIRFLLSLMKFDYSFTPLPAPDFELWHVAASVPIGMACGALGATLLIATAVLAKIRSSTSKLLARCLPMSIAVVFFPSLAGTLHGLLAVAAPYTSTDWFQLLLTLVSANETTRLPTMVLLATMMAKLASLAICLGFGLIGGMVLPMVMVGGLLGNILADWLDVLPRALAVPCCLAACPVAVCPAPFTATVAVSLVLWLDSEQTLPVLVASVMAWLVTGGLGVVKRIEEWRQDSLVGMHDAEDDDTPEYTEDDEGRPMSEDEFLSTVRSIIFGSSP